MTEIDNDQAEWVEIGSFSTGLEADVVRQSLEAEGIPVLLKSDAPGIFGAGFQGAVTGGVVLFVPDVEYDRAAELLDLQP